MYGPTVDEQTRCVHYRTELDVIAIRYVCCDRYYPCHLCHEETADHPARPWPASARDQNAVLCGVCGTELSVNEYVSVDACPHCAAAFNPGCALHYPLYFE
ncbi:hypothetical protein D9V32_00780 [Mycetocola tolaasinivorans]|uniref:CHY-type domain-containing protein n=1 Tax=Mycetocola tolaasinivorans TaxID=76635 RepID=A0A3L7ABX0_9MICO|nr:hypothetical protein D9V32_00780 [Mycetocola tolaasinivorans]